MNRIIRSARGLGLLGLLAIAAPALANMAEPPRPHTVRPGSSAGELGGGLGQVRVLGERLTIDLRPLARGRLAEIEAVYRLHGDGPPADVTLWFVADALAGEDRGIWLDGRPLQSAPVPEARLPDAWLAPASTPDPAGGEPLPYQRGRERVIGFRVSLQPGEHELRVRYHAEPSAFQDEGLMPVWQLGYVLAPAREWAGFGALDVRVELPRGWIAAATPELQREGSALVGQWQGIPANALAIAARAPAPASKWRYGLVGLGGLVGLWLLARLGRALGAALGRRGRSWGWTIPVAAAAALALCLGVVGAWAAVPGWVAADAGPYANRYEINRMSYGGGMLMILLLPVTLLAGFAAVLVSSARAARRARTSRL